MQTGKDQSVEELLQSLQNLTGSESEDLEEFEKALNDLAQKHETAKQTLVEIIEEVHEVRAEINQISDEEETIRELWSQMRADMIQGQQEGVNQEFKRKFNDLDEDLKGKLGRIRNQIKQIRQKLSQLEEEFGEEQKEMKLVEKLDNETNQDMSRMLNMENAISQAEMEIEKNL